MSARIFQDPLDLYRLLEESQDSDSSYRAVLQETKRRVLAKHGPKAVHFADLLEEIDESPALVEDAIRAAGFVAGFNACRELLLAGRR